MLYVGVYAFFALLFALFGALSARKYKWQFALIRVASVVLAAVVSVLALRGVASALTGVLTKAVKTVLEFFELSELLALENAFEWVAALVGMALGLILFMPVFFAVKALINLLLRCICKPIFRAVSKKKTTSAKPLKKQETTSTESLVSPSEQNASSPTYEEESVEEIENEEIESDDALVCEQNVDVISEEETPVYTESQPEPQPLNTEQSPESEDESDDEESFTKEERKRRRNPLLSPKASPLSLLFGAVCGFLIFNFIIAPAVCFVGDAGSVASTLLSVFPSTEAVGKNIESLSDNASIDIVSYTGGRFIYEGLASFKIRGETVVIGNELEFAADAAELFALIKNDKGEDADETAELIDDMLESFEKTALVPIAISDVADGISESWLENESFIGVERPKFNNAVDGVVDDALTLFVGSTAQTIRADVYTLCKMLSVAIENGLLEAEGAEGFLALLENKRCTEQMIEVLLENERLSPLVVSATNMGISELGKALGIPANDQVMYDAFLEAVNTALVANAGESEQDRILRISSEVKAAYDAAGIAIPKGAEYTVASTLFAKYENAPGVDTIKRFFANENGELALYAEICGILNSRAAEENALVTKLVSLGISAEAAEAVAAKIKNKIDLTAGAQAASTLSVKSVEELSEKTVRITLEDMHIESMNITDKSKEAEILSDVISEAMTIAPAVSGANKENITELIDRVGVLLDTLSESESIDSETLSATVTGTLQADMIRETLGVSSTSMASMSNNMSDGVKNGEKYSDHLTTISKTVDVITNKGNSEQSVEDVKELIVNVTPSTSDTLKEIVSDEFLEKQGVPEKNSVAVSGVFSKMFDEMADVNANNPDSEYVAKEAKAVSTALDIVTKDSEDFKNGVFGEKNESEEKIEEYVFLVNDSDIMTNVLIDTVYGDGDTPKLDPMGFEQSLPEHERDLVIEELDETYKKKIASGASAEEIAEQEKLTISIAAFLNLNVKISNGNVTLG